MVMRASLAFVLIAVAGLSAAQPPAGGARAPAGNADNGKKIFVSYGCYQCHNYAANGGNAGPKLAPNPIAFAAFMRQLRKPRTEMPPYTAKVVTDQEVTTLAVYGGI